MLPKSTNKHKLVPLHSPFKTLSHPHHQENNIGNIGEVAHLVPLKNLKSVYFKNIDGSQRNPLCEHPSYRSSIVRQLPQLTILDGERLKHANTVYRFPLPPLPPPAQQKSLTPHVRQHHVKNTKNYTLPAKTKENPGHEGTKMEDAEWVGWG